jgi:putative transposase
MVRWQLYYHVVFGTKLRDVVLGPDARTASRDLLWQKARDLGCFIHAIHVRPDHVHIVLSIPPSRAISFVVGQIKGRSSRGLANLLPPWVSNVWQEGYGVFTFGERDLAEVVAYVQNQDQHHAARQLRTDWEIEPDDT